MRYKIGARVIYDATDNTLTLPSCKEPDSQLSITAGALLYYFLCHTDVVSRNEVLKKVWDDNGLTSSNSNLNQYLSMLRKTLRHYDVDNIIVSVSRGLLQLNPDITIEPLTAEPVPLPETFPEPFSAEVAPPLFQEAITPSDNKQGKQGYLAGCSLLGIALLVVVLTTLNGNELRPISFIRVRESSCELLSNDEMLHSVTGNLYKKNFNAVRQRLKLACQPGEYFVFFYDNKLETNGLGRVFLAHCATQKDKPFSYCNNYFYYAWKT